MSITDIFWIREYVEMIFGRLHYILTGFFLLAGFTLSGCSLHEEGSLTPNRLQVKQEKFIEEIAVSDLDENYIRALGRHYNRHGDGPVDLTVLYDPGSPSGTAMQASNKMADLAASFRQQGLSPLKANILPVQDMGGDLQVVISYISYSALPPKDCTVMAGFDDTDIDVNKDYKMGCTVETAFAKQIARPKDLKGQGQTDPTSEGRRAGNIVEIYRSGAPNEALEGESASED